MNTIIRNNIINIKPKNTRDVKVSVAKKTDNNPISIVRKAFEKKRKETLKENVNKLLVIASSDVKEYSDFFKELDEIHKKEVGQFVDSIKNNMPNQDKKEPNSDDNENIFVTKD